MTPTRRGFFTALFAIPFAPKCILAMRPKSSRVRAASAVAYAYRDGGHTFYILSYSRGY